eukprot:scaffold279657_cov30-Tisochrysis_lutea.AAC.2
MTHLDDFIEATTFERHTIDTQHAISNLHARLRTRLPHALHISGATGDHVHYKTATRRTPAMEA